MRFGRSILLVALAATAGTVHAAGAGLRIGTTGVGADFGWDIAPTLGGRVGLSGGNISRDFSTDDVKYDAKLKLANANLFLDWSPLGPFRITAGVIPNNNKIDLSGEPNGNGTFTINGVTYSAAQVGSLSGNVKPGNSIAPYLGIGYGNVWTKGVNFYFDLGVMFQGSPKVSLQANCNPTVVGAAQCAAIQNDVEAERQKVEDKVKKYQYFPVANIGITIGF
jgi:hypothetical protein